jgi:hypothetical protein
MADCSCSQPRDGYRRIQLGLLIKKLIAGRLARFEARYLGLLVRPDMRPHDFNYSQTVIRFPLIERDTKGYCIVPWNG